MELLFKRSDGKNFQINKLTITVPPTDVTGDTAGELLVQLKPQNNNVMQCHSPLNGLVYS